MNDSQNRRYQMFVRVREFFAQRIGDFQPTSVAVQLYNSLIATITRLETHFGAQAAGAGQARQMTQTRGDARRALRADLQTIHRAARVMGIADKFPFPDSESDSELLSLARGAAANAEPLKAQFIAHEMPADFLDDLNAGITALEASIVGQGNAVGDRVESRAAADDAIDEGIETVRKLDGIIKIKYANNPGVLAEWTSASHTERAPKRTPVPPPSPPPPSA